MSVLLRGFHCGSDGTSYATVPSFGSLFPSFSFFRTPSFFSSLHRHHASRVSFFYVSFLGRLLSSSGSVWLDVWLAVVLRSLWTTRVGALVVKLVQPFRRGIGKTVECGREK